MLNRYPGETNEQLIARSEIEDAVQNLMRVSNKYDAVVVGFVVGVSPALMVQMHGCKETGADFTAMMLKLCTVSEQKHEKNKFMRVKVST